VETKTKGLKQQADELKHKLKEKETLLRIAKFKLSEMQRNIKHTQLKPLDAIKSKVDPLQISSEKRDPTKQQVKAGIKARSISSPRAGINGVYQVNPKEKSPKQKRMDFRDQS